MLKGRSSSSEDQDENFSNHHFKKIDYIGNDFSSQNQESMNDDSKPDSQPKNNDRNQQKEDINRLLCPEDKSKVIKKNRQSAKMSRLRRKQYQQKLQQRVIQLQSQTTRRKANIKNISEQIFNKFQRSNIDKHKYLSAKLSSSKKLLTLINKINELRSTVAKQSKTSKNIPLEQQQGQIIKNEFNPTINNPLELDEDNLELIKQYSKVKPKKKKSDNKNQQSRLQQIAEKQTSLELALKNYMYEFGMRGCFRKDVIERSKYQWLQILSNFNVEPNEQVCKGVVSMKNCLQRLDGKSKLLDFHIRELREKVKAKYALQFMLDKQFFKRNVQAIQQNIQLKDQQK